MLSGSQMSLARGPHKDHCDQGVLPELGEQSDCSLPRTHSSSIDTAQHSSSSWPLPFAITLLTLLLNLPYSP